MAAPASLMRIVFPLLSRNSSNFLRSGVLLNGPPSFWQLESVSKFSTLVRSSNLSGLPKANKLWTNEAAELIPERLVTSCALAAISGRPKIELVLERGAHNEAGKVYDVLSEVNSVGLENLVPADGTKESIVRQEWPSKLESGLNDMINVSYSISYALHALSSYCSRDYVSLRGLARWYIDRSNRERADALELSRYQSLRGGKTMLCPIGESQTDFDHDQKGDALYTMELVLAMYKLQEQKFRDLARLADEEGDQEFSDFITDSFLSHLTVLVKKTAGYVAQLRRVGKGHGTWHFDHYLHKKLEGDHVGDELRTGLHELEGTK
ncbi:Ferritin [Klebsormidium nitens]|uniref:Ferritin n=1 Tax=Klebsormidium nitens TaxID=105231 RepID=A0A1Y1HVP2_KLENI|nr:Ferritin [Klebsormidium nitens]|eukprot:GAQ81882.1 Ferritin [Klebsormidium nitens]